MSEGESVEETNSSQSVTAAEKSVDEPRAHSLEEKKTILAGALKVATVLNDQTQDASMLEPIAGQMQDLGVHPGWFSANVLMDEASPARQRLSRTVGLDAQQVEAWMLGDADFTQPPDAQVNVKAFRTQADRSLEVAQRTGMLEERPLTVTKSPSGREQAARTFRMPGSRLSGSGNFVKEK